MINSVLCANISWNPFNWQKPYKDPRAGHEYARKHHGHESLNFDFNKTGIDTETHVYGFSQWKYHPKHFSNGGYVVFYSRNLDNNKPLIVGIYGEVELLFPHKKFQHKQFENGVIEFNMLAVKPVSLLLPVPLDCRNYKKGRMVGQIGFTYYDEDLVKKVVSDEYHMLKQVGGNPQSILAKLDRIYKRITGTNLFDSSTI